MTETRIFIEATTQQKATTQANFIYEGSEYIRIISLQDVKSSVSFFSFLATLLIITVKAHLTFCVVVDETNQFSRLSLRSFSLCSRKLEVSSDKQQRNVGSCPECFGLY